MTKLKRTRNQRAQWEKEIEQNRAKKKAKNSSKLKKSYVFSAYNLQNQHEESNREDKNDFKIKQLVIFYFMLII